MDSPQPGMESEKQINDEEVKSVIEVMAASGKYWHDWDKLKGMLSFHLKQVLSDYPEAKMTIEQQQSCLGESLPELAKRLDDALNSFAEGPPFTLQRLCEILLDARNIYSKLTKLALALEKNLLVTSTLTISSDPYTIQNAITEAGTETETETKGSPVESNGVEPITSAGDADEVMAEVEEAEVEDVMTVDMDTIEAIVRSSEAADTTPTSDS
ncbi:serine/threonine-protein phosphatase 4 regulatory subunit 2 [Solanum tuberosum]|uniref:serine/threonine-protein phosphatase 4 regulatory subunit 2 n=1 Tax=Solanum tuberosum TaxID=4113 RepID=UPI0003D258FF|nr:PREDICTED: serine/threonine-protein phosphatase 4 regulatory subunit 2 [Solanum tuberosum]